MTERYVAILGAASSVKSGAPSIWPPPAPPKHFDRSQLPSNLRPSTLNRPSEDGDGEEETDGQHDVPRENRISQPCGGGSGGGSGSSRDGHNHANRAPRHGGPSSHGEGNKELSQTAVVPEEVDKTTEDMPPGSVNADGSMIGSGEPIAAVMDDVELVGEAMRETTISERTDAVEEGYTTEAIGTAHHVKAVDETGSNMAYGLESSNAVERYQEPMVIEFSIPASDGAPRSGHKRVRTNSGPTQNDYIRPYAKRPVTFYGEPFVFLLYY